MFSKCVCTEFFSRTMSKQFQCHTCEQVHDDDFTDFCANCGPVEFQCSGCNNISTKPFKDVCNVCVETRKQDCQQCTKQTLVLCDGCDYPVCLRHADTFSIVRVNNVTDVLHFCNGYENPHMCRQAFIRLKINLADYADAYFPREWLTAELPELCVTRKWAERQKRIVPSIEQSN